MTELAGKVIRAPRAEPELDLEDENCEADQRRGHDPNACHHANMDVEEEEEDNEPVTLAGAGGDQATNMDLDLDHINDNLQDIIDDNVSLEVQFGDGSSCRASDVSSLSFQNIVFDDNDTPPEVMRSRRDSEDSSDSYQNDFTEADAQAFSGQLEKFHRQKRRANDRSNTSSPAGANVDDMADADEPMGEHHTGTMKRRSKVMDAEPESDQQGDNDDAAMSPRRHHQGGDDKSRCQRERHVSDEEAGTSQHENQHTAASQRCHSLINTAEQQSTTTTTTKTAAAANKASTTSNAARNNTSSSAEATSASSSSGNSSTQAANANSTNSKDTTSNTTSGEGKASQDSHNNASCERAHNQTERSAVDQQNDNHTDTLPPSTSSLSSSSSSSPVTATDAAVTTATTTHHQSDNSNNSSSSSGGGQTMSEARNSLEVRNNIPVYRQVKDYHHDTDTRPHHHPSSHHHPHHTAMPRIKKISPGLARRLSSDSRSDERDTSSSEKETDPQLDYTVKSGHAEMRSRLDNGIVPQPHPMHHEPWEDDSGGGSGGSSGLGTISEQESREKACDIENEYDYVKWTRVQEGDSYVGMRLAYASSNDSLSYNNRQRFRHSGTPSDDGHYLGSSRENSPEKILQPRISEHMHRNVNEDTLTEIPLNGNDIGSGEEQKNFSLSPEATECDSAEVESVLSDEGKSSTSGMPVVEDGLSSSQCSDIDEAFATHDPRRPAEILKRRYRNEMEQQGITTNGFELCRGPHSQEKESENMSQSSPLSSPSSMDHCQNTADRDALSLAIQDIKTAIKRSKSATLKSPYQENSASTEEPIWIMRDAYTRKQQRQDEMRRVRDEIERQQEEEYVKREEDTVAELDDEGEHSLKFQFGRNTGKGYQRGKGYESDDEFEDHDQREKLSKKSSRWNKGRTYAAISTDDVTDHNYLRNDPRQKHHSRLNTANFNMYNRYGSKSETALNRESSSSPALSTQNNQTNSSNQTLSNRGNVSNSYNTSRGYSSEDSEKEANNDEKTAYVKPHHPHEGDYDTDEETDQLLNRQYTQTEKIEIPELSRPPVNRSAQVEKRRSRAKEVILPDPDNETVLIEGVLFRARYLGSTQLISEGQPSKAMRMMQAQEAVGRIKAPEGENQPSTDVDLFVSTEKIMVLNTDLQEIMMDHALRTISYIADIGDIVVIMARRRNLTNPADELLHRRKQTKILCHVFESDEAQLIAQSIGQAFSVAYMEFLKANGIEDMGLVKEMDYQEVLNQQEIFGEELFMFSNKEMTKEVIVPKVKGDPLGVVVVESGWGSMVPTVVLANMSPTGAAARCGQLNIGDQIMSVNGVSLVGLPLSSCQNYIKATRNQTVVKLSVVSCAPVVEVCIKRPDVKYQLGFSVQNGVICSLLRGGIAERGGVRVGHRIIEINNNSVVAVQHEKIVNMLATSVGEIHMKTMPTSIYRLLTGQEAPHYI